MENVFSFGTYHVPSTVENLSATYTVPSIAPKEVIEKLIESDKKEVEEAQRIEMNRALISPELIYSHF